MTEEKWLKIVKRQREIAETITMLTQEHKALECDINSRQEVPDWARRAAERAFTEADRWHQGIAPYDVEKVARVIEEEFMRSTVE